MHIYDNLPEAINGLQIRGFVLDLNAQLMKIIQRENIQLLIPTGLEIVEH